MKNLSFIQPPPVYIEIGEETLKAFRENSGVEIPLERSADGRLTPPGREKLVAGLQKFLMPRQWQMRPRAWCAIHARGVSLRRLSLPPGAKEEFQQRLLLQIEAGFPLSPEELAWGSQMINGTSAKQELLVAAVKKEVLVEYQTVLRNAGVEPAFTLASLARMELCQQIPEFCALLDIGNTRSELSIFEKGILVNSRMIIGGSENAAGLTDGLSGLLRTNGTGAVNKKLLISGNKVSESFTAQLVKSLGVYWQTERLEPASGAGQSAAIAGLQKMAGQGREPALVLRGEQASTGMTGLGTLDLKKWGIRAGALVLALVLLPYAGAILLKPHLAKKVEAFKVESERLGIIDHELEFLRGLKQSQPPYIAELSVFSKSVPPGTHFDALSLNSHGDVSLRCAFHDGQQVADFRTKLIVSGFFTNVTVEEQIPTPDHQRVNVRISAQEKPVAQLQALATSMEAEEAAREARQTSATNPPIASSAGMPLRKEGQ